MDRRSPITTLADIFATQTGNPPDLGEDSSRFREIKAVTWHVLGIWTAEQIARAEQIHFTTFFDWKRRAPRYREAEGLRRLMALKVDDADLID